MPLPTVISDISPIVGTGAAPNAGQPGGGENPSTFDDYLRLYAAFIAQLRDGAGFTDGVKSNSLGSAGAPAFSFVGDTDTGMFSPGANILAATTGGAERMRIDASGNVGIGTAPTLGALEVRTAGGTPTLALANSGTRYGFLQWSNAIDALRMGVDGAFSLVFSTQALERMRIDASGNVGIGTASPLSQLHVLRASSSSVRIDTDSAASTTQLNFAVSGANRWSLYRPSGSNDLRIFDNTNTLDVVTWQAGGQQINNSNSVTPPTLTTNGQWNLTPTSNTNMRISYRGTDGVTRVGNITLA